MKRPLIKTENLFKHYENNAGFFSKLLGQNKTIKAVNGVTLDVFKGETLGLVGESGCGKSTLGRTIIGLEKASSGYLEFDGVEINKIKKRAEIIKLRKRMQIIFQNTSSTFDPRMTVKEIIGEPIKIHFNFTEKERDQRIGELLEQVGFDWDYTKRYPRQLSDGQIQRIAIIRALSVNPEFVVADEPVSALDVSVQAQVLNLLKRLKQKLELTTLFISHDLNVVYFLSDRIAVIYFGKIVELGTSSDVFDNTKHPYSKVLLSSNLDLSPEINFCQMKILNVDSLNRVDLTTGCVFHLKCPEATKKCKEIAPTLKEVNKGHYASCLYV